MWFAKRTSLYTIEIENWVAKTILHAPIGWNLSGFETPSGCRVISPFRRESVPTCRRTGVGHDGNYGFFTLGGHGAARTSRAVSRPSWACAERLTLRGTVRTFWR